MSSNGLDKLERKLITMTMKRLQRWKREHPEGLRQWGHPQAIEKKDAWNFMKACVDLDNARKKGKP